jgi:hypothetical protein
VHFSFSTLCGIIFGFLLLSAVNTAVADMVSIQYVMSRDTELPHVLTRLNFFGVPWYALVAAVGLPVIILNIFQDLGTLASLYAVGVVGAQLPLPLSVRIESDGEPRAGVTVEWEASAGTILPARTVSDATGLASATWTLGPGIGAMSATSTVAGASGSPVVFSATGRAPFVRATPMSPTNGQTGVVGTALPLPLRVQVTSEGAFKAGMIVHWHPTSGSMSPIRRMGLRGLIGAPTGPA